MRVLVTPLMAMATSAGPQPAHAPSHLPWLREDGKQRFAYPRVSGGQFPQT